MIACVIGRVFIVVLACVLFSFLILDVYAQIKMHNDKIAKEEQRIKNEESKVQRALMKELKDERIRKLKEEEKEKAEMAIREKYTNL